MKRCFRMGILVAMVGCSTTKNDVAFRIENYSSTQITVNYILTESNDTVSSTINSNQSLVLLEKQLNQTTNWYNDFDININLITNQLGDTINFDPNVASYWIFSVASPHTYYKLQLTDSSFL